MPFDSVPPRRSSDRPIDPELMGLEGGLFRSLPPDPPPEAPVRPRTRARADSLAPTTMEALVGPEVAPAPASPRPPLRLARHGAAVAALAAVAGLGLFTDVGSRVERSAAALLGGAEIRASRVAAALPEEAADEALTLDEVFIDLDEPEEMAAGLLVSETGNIEPDEVVGSFIAAAPGFGGNVDIAVLEPELPEAMVLPVSSPSTSPLAYLEERAADFDRAAAAVSLADAAMRASRCGAERGTRASVTFSPSGRVSGVQVAGSSGAEAACVAAAMRSASVRPFTGAPVTLHRSVGAR